MNAVSRVTLTTVLALAGLDAVARVPDKCIVVLEARPTRNDTSRAPCPLLITYPAPAAGGSAASQRPARDASRRAPDGVVSATGNDATASAGEAPAPATHA